MFKLFDTSTMGKLLRKKEDQLFDRVSGRIKWQDVGNLLMGFAHSDGGVLAIGIEKDLTVTGVNDEFQKKSEVTNSAMKWLDPPLRVKIKFFPCKNHKKENSNILLVEIPPSIKLHKNLKDEVYLRIGDENICLNHEQRKILLDEKSKGSFESRKADGFTINNLDKDLISKYCRAINRPKSKIEDIITGRDLAVFEKKNLSINFAGILLFGVKPERWLERARIRILKYEGDYEKTGENLNIIKDISIYGPIPVQVEQSHKIISSLLRDFSILSKAGKFITEKEYPDFAWKEAVVNAVVHRSYSLRGADIQIKIFNNRLEVISPGRFPGFVTSKNIQNTHYSRNPRIARVMSELGFIKEIGEGVNRIIEVMEKSKLPKPVFLEKSSGEVLVQLENNINSRRLYKEGNLKQKMDTEVLASLNPTEQKILGFVFEYEKITTKECQELIKRHRMTALRQLVSLVKKGFLRRIGNKGPLVKYIIGQKLPHRNKKKKQNISAQGELF